MPDDDRSLPAAGDGSKHQLGGRPARFWVILGLSVLGFVLVLQNSGNTEVQILWFTIRMPLVFLLLAMVGIGAGLDRVWHWRQRAK